MLNLFESRLESALLSLSEDFSSGKGQALNLFSMGKAPRVYYHSLPKPVKDAISRIPDIVSYEDIERIYKDSGYYYVETRSGHTVRFDEQGKYQFSKVDLDQVDFDKPLESQSRVKIE